MQYLRTTVRLNPRLKKAVEKKALDLDMTFQAVLEKALENYLNQENYQKAQKIVFKSQDIGVALDNLDREALYAD